MKLSRNPSPVVGLVTLLITVSLAQAGLVFTIENPGVQASTVPGVTTETFDSYALGAFSGASPIGTFSSGGNVVAADAFGGAFGSDYYAVGVQSGHTSATLTLPGSEHYFGLWWSAGDSQNQLSFYDGATLLGTYNVATLLALHLSSGYFGNPNNGLDKGEPFVYLDFTTTGSDAITSVVFNNTLTTGFEMDNLSILSTPITPPGHSIPDGGSSLLLLSTAATALIGLRRKLQMK